LEIGCIADWQSAQAGVGNAAIKSASFHGAK